MSASTTDLRPSLASRVDTLVRDAGNLARDHLELAALEAQRAAIGLTKVLVAAVVVSILAVTAWLTLVASAIVWAAGAGVTWPVALCAAAAVNVAVAAGIVVWLRRQKDEFLFAATLRQLKRTAQEMKEEAA